MSDYNNGIVNGYVWFPIYGSRQDYMNYYAQCREVTIECSFSHTPDPSQMPMYWTFNHESMLCYMEQSLYGIHGTVTDSITGEPLEATVFIEGHDHHGSEVSSHMPAGDYHRPIKGGTYDVTFSCEGYRPKTFTLTVTDRETLVHDVQLVTKTYGLDENYVSGDCQYPAEYRIIDVMGHILMKGRIDSESQQIDYSNLPNGIYFITIGGSTTKFLKN